MAFGWHSGRVHVFKYLVFLYGVLINLDLKAQLPVGKYAPNLLNQERSGSSGRKYQLVVSDIDSFAAKLLLMGYSKTWRIFTGQQT